MNKKITKRQADVLDDMFADGGDIEQALKKHKVTLATYNRWHSDAAFADAFDQRIEIINRHSRLLVARFTSVAAARLIELTDSASPETARKACLDIIAVTKPITVVRSDKDNNPEKKENLDIDPQLAHKILTAAASN